MKGKLVFVATMLMLFITFNVERVSAEEEDPTQALHDLVEEQIDILKMDEIQVFWNEIVDEYGGFFARESERFSN